MNSGGPSSTRLLIASNLMTFRCIDHINQSISSVATRGHHFLTQIKFLNRNAIRSQIKLRTPFAPPSSRQWLESCRSLALGRKKPLLQFAIRLWWTTVYPLEYFALQFEQTLLRLLFRAHGSLLLLRRIQF